jgi:hypothetical protein
MDRNADRPARANHRAVRGWPRRGAVAASRANGRSVALLLEAEVVDG